MDHLTNLSMRDEFRPRFFKPNLFEPSKHNFDSFPKEAGYCFNERQELQPIEGANVTDIDSFLQSWLFFGLIATVVPFPSFSTGDFLSEDRSQIDPSNLVKDEMYLEKWKQYEIQNKDDRTIRMIRAQVALDRAREVVQNHCSMDGKCYIKGKVDEELSLSLMVLGETLSNAKSKIVEEISFNIRGWHGDATEGWGHPQCLISKMELAGWCPRTLYVLKGQLNSSATSMLSAYKSHGDSGLLKPGSHPDCKAKEPCLVVSADDKGDYKTQHHVQCPDYAHPEGKTCRMIGPPMATVLKDIEHDNFPLLCYRDKVGGGTIEAEPYRPHDKYATISHVWADGYGNPKKNELWECQLKFFQKLFAELPDRRYDNKQTMLFWIDTLAIPVGKSERHKKARQRAIKKIHDIYTKARYTVVIDNGLTQMGPSTSYEDAAMKILASGWMRRLWTLQEAYLSRRIYFAFKKGELKNLDDLEDMYPKASDILTSNIPTAARNYFHSMLGPDRNARINELSSGSGYGLLASVWRAAQWRTTAHKEHETLALATLLNVEYQDSGISKAGLIPDEELLIDDKKRRNQRELDEMMRDLWKIINETCPGSIPAGIIFLLGKRNAIEGYRWAPRTWMSGEKIDYPDPLSIMTSPATLTDKGLAVIYPGFLLHSRPGRSILSMRNQGKQKDQEFHFAIDSSLLEWYVVDWGIEPLSNAPIGLKTGDKSLAIILCRPRPRELPEIALLVEIEKTIKQRSLVDHRQSNTYHVFIVCRVKIRRETKEDFLTQWKETISQSINQSGVKDEVMIFGEVLDEQQQWYVDGRPGPGSMPQDVERDQFSSLPKATETDPRRSGVRKGLILQTGSSKIAASSSLTSKRIVRAGTSTFLSHAVPNGGSPEPGSLPRSSTVPVSATNAANRDTPRKPSALDKPVKSGKHSRPLRR